MLQGIDIFSKDYLFVPVHDALHWSLVIICHPALLQKAAAAQGWSLHPEALAEPAAAAGGDSDGSQGDKAAVARTAGASDAAGRIVPAPCILHLDSMTCEQLQPWPSTASSSVVGYLGRFILLMSCSELS